MNIGKSLIAILQSEMGKSADRDRQVRELIDHLTEGPQIPAMTAGPP